MQNFGMFTFMLLTTFLTVGLLTYGLSVFFSNRRTLRERFKKPKPQDDPLLKLRRRDKKSRLKERLIKLVSPFGKFAMKEKEEEEDLTDLRITLIRAGFRHSAAPAVYFGFRILLAVGIPLIYMLYILLFKGGANAFKVMGALMLAAIGYYGPVYGLKFWASRRQDRIDRALPDVLDLMIVSMEAGLSLQAALNRVADESNRISKELSRELQITNAELRTGIPRDVALKNLGERTGVASVKSLVALMIQSERMGASIANALRNHASFTRVQRAQRAEEVAAKMPIKIIFPTLLCIFPAIFIVILGPAAISIYRTLVK
jgi:tight adherence protein C